MHKKGTPRDMQKAPGYIDVLAEVRTYLFDRAEQVIKSGLSGDRIILDPGIGFGKSPADNLILINRLAEIRSKDYPILIALSRKSFIGE
jgi:dihydropteroate synthase